MPPITINMKLVVGVIAVFILLSFVSCGVEVVETGHRGVKTTWGKVVSESLPEGLYFYFPIGSDIHVLDTRVLKWDPEGGTVAYTKDVQQAEIRFVLNYRLDPTKAHIIFQTVGRDWSQKLVGQVVHEEIKREFGQHNAVDIVFQRDKASRVIEETITRKLAAREVVVTGFQITNIDYTPEFEHAVEAKVIAQQKAIEEQNRTVQIREQATQKIETAKGAAEARVLNAEAEAKSIRLRGQALSENPKLIEWQTIIEWDGVLPKTMLGEAVPLVQLDPDK